MVECCDQPPFAADDFIQLMPCPPPWNPSVLAIRAVSNGLASDVIVKLLHKCGQMDSQTTRAASPPWCGLWCAAGFTAGVGLLVITGLVFVWMALSRKLFRRVAVANHNVVAKDVSKINMQTMKAASQSSLSSCLNLQKAEQPNHQGSQNTDFHILNENQNQVCLTVNDCQHDSNKTYPIQWKQSEKHCNAVDSFECVATDNAEVFPLYEEDFIQTNYSNKRNSISSNCTDKTSTI